MFINHNEINEYLELIVKKYFIRWPSNIGMIHIFHIDCGVLPKQLAALLYTIVMSAVCTEEFSSYSHT